MCDRGLLVGLCIQDYTSLCTVVTTYATLVVPKLIRTFWPPMTLKSRSNPTLLCIHLSVVRQWLGLLVWELLTCLWRPSTSYYIHCAEIWRLQEKLLSLRVEVIELMSEIWRVHSCNYDTLSVCVNELMFRMNTSSLIRELVQNCGREDETDIWYYISLRVYHSHTAVGFGSAMFCHSILHTGYQTDSRVLCNWWSQVDQNSSNTNLVELLVHSSWRFWLYQNDLCFSVLIPSWVGVKMS